MHFVGGLGLQSIMTLGYTKKRGVKIGGFGYCFYKRSSKCRHVVSKSKGIALSTSYVVFKWTHYLALLCQVILDLLDCVLSSVELQKRQYYASLW